MHPFYTKLSVVCALFLTSNLLWANGPQVGSARFYFDNSSFELGCELDYVIVTPGEQFMGMVCEDPDNMLVENQSTGDSDIYQIEDVTDGQLYTLSCRRTGELNLSHGLFITDIDCRSMGKPAVALGGP
ncbi:MAG: hypothetical protein DHS20C11_12420 [Lysobacteraceae bacterium]|nr:MAG: hypothetical protein DHS20C11_12420 [Xanthomonadaceae bacterium]